MGKLFVIEGTDSSGKQTQLELLKKRLTEAKIDFKSVSFPNYDNDSFKYVKTTKALMKNFKKFIGDLPLLIIDNSYTRNYLEEFDNKKESIFKYLNLDMSDDVFDRLVNKYNLKIYGAIFSHIIFVQYLILIAGHIHIFYLPKLAN